MYIRKRKNPSGSISVAAVVKRHGKSREVKIFGTADTDEEVSKLYAAAQHWLLTNGNQLPQTLFFTQKFALLADFV